MTKNSDEVRAEALEMAGSTVLTTVLHVWVTKRAVYHLTGRNVGWGGAYSVLAAIQAAGYWADAGRQSRVDLWAKAKLLKNKAEVQKSRGQK
jgi:hypothetical protein